MLSDRRFIQTSTTQILGGLEAQVGISIASQGAKLVDQWFWGYRYSRADYKRYTELVRIYGQILERETPQLWSLDEHRKPLFQISHYKWSSYLQELPREKGQLHYYSQSALIIEYLSTYLAARAKRWFGKGKAGDLLELFMAEWLHFALNELPSYQYDNTALQKIKKRLRYLSCIQKHEALFSFGFKKRRKNKFDVLESIRQQLLECEALAKEQALRNCAREKFRSCCNGLAQILLASVNSLYYARALAVYDEPLNLHSFMDPATFLTGPAEKLYPKIKYTPTGALLQEVVFLAKLDTFGKPKTKLKPIELLYFNEDGQLKELVSWPAQKDLPQWLQKEEEALQYLNETRILSESILRLAKLKGLLEEVYQLTGMLGDLWLYGDKRGKLSLEGLLFLLEQELDLFEKRYASLYQYQEMRRERASNQNRVERLNFNKVDDQKFLIDGFLPPLLETVEGLRKKMLEFSEEEVSCVDARKEAFYQSVSRYVKQYYPDKHQRFQLLEEVLSDEEVVAAFGLAQPLLAQKPLPFSKRLFYGENFASWRKKYFARHQTEFYSLARLLLQYEKKLNEESLEGLAACEGQLQTHLTLMKGQAERERPRWALGWFSFCVGWPFHRNLTQNITFFLGELDLLAQDAQNTAQEEKKRRAEQEKTALESELPQVKTQQNPLSSFFYRDNKSTIFTIKSASGQLCEGSRREGPAQNSLKL